MQKITIEPTGFPLQQLYKLCINHLIESGYNFNLEYEHENQVVIDMGKNGCIDFFENRTTNVNQKIINGE